MLTLTHLLVLVVPLMLHGNALKAFGYVCVNQGRVNCSKNQQSKAPKHTLVNGADGELQWLLFLLKVFARSLCGLF